MRTIVFLSLLLVNNFAFAAASDFANKILLIQQVENNRIKNSFLGSFIQDPVTQSYHAKNVNIMVGAFVASCLKEDFSTCERSGSYKELFETAFRMNVASSTANQAQIDGLPDIVVKIKTDAERIDENTLRIKVTLANQTSEFTIKKVSKLSDVAAKFAELEDSKPRRFDVTEVEDNKKDFAFSVVQLEKETDYSNTLYSGVGGNGTGFFISSDGLMMTNHHVLSAFMDCMVKLYCTIKLNQTLPDNSRKTTSVKATILAMSAVHDFVLLKIKLPDDFKVKPLSLNLKTIGKELMTLGFPGDRRSEKTEITKLTYSFGKLVGFNSIAYQTTAFISSGASGSPVLNLEDMEVVGILSNGLGHDVTGAGDAGVVRPLPFIESEFELSKYLDGTKQNKIKEILRKLKQIDDIDAANALLEAFISQKTFYGVPYLKEIMLQHKSPKIRKMILKALQQAGVVNGN